jgi:hypothetical protein
MEKRAEKEGWVFEEALGPLFIGHGEQRGRQTL